MPITNPYYFAVEVEKGITCEWQKLSFVSNKYVSQVLNQMWQTKKLLDLIFFSSIQFKALLERYF